MKNYPLKTKWKTIYSSYDRIPDELVEQFKKDVELTKQNNDRVSA